MKQGIMSLSQALVDKDQKALTKSNPEDGKNAFDGHLKMKRNVNLLINNDANFIKSKELVLTSHRANSLIKQRRNLYIHGKDNVVKVVGNNSLTHVSNLQVFDKQLLHALEINKKTVLVSCDSRLLLLFSLENYKLLRKY
mmetsp:Transcript_17536/g.16759  ORF Transcript_17536/g.16759 Transcript_17536/m.16759 type:complete len:140 (+) Transcript_17536:458-877(+)